MERQTGHPLGYVEQLYTFADRDRSADDPARRVISISYLGLAFDPSEHATLVWSGPANAAVDTTVHAARRLRGKGWSAQQLIHPKGYGVAYTADRSGIGTLVYTQLLDDKSRPTSDVMVRRFE